MIEQMKFSIKSRIFQIILIGLLSIFYAEVCSGSYPLWFMEEWGLTITFPLYWAHILFFITLAFMTKRTKLRDLYLWGVLFGLYEAWITKVVWAGYPSTPPLLSTMFGFAIAETLVIVFFWHPVFSFIMPILTFEIFAINLSRKIPNEQLENVIILSHNSYIKKTPFNIFIYFVVLMIGANSLAFNSGYNTFVVLLSSIGTFAIIAATLVISRYTSQYLSIHSTKLKWYELIIVIIYLAYTYITSYFELRPEAIPDLFTILLTIGIYAFIVLLLFVSGKDSDTNNKIPEANIITLKVMIILFADFIIFAVLLSLLPIVSETLFIVFYLSFIRLGPAFLFIVILKIIYDRIKMLNISTKNRNL